MNFEGIAQLRTAVASSGAVDARKIATVSWLTLLLPRLDIRHRSLFLGKNMDISFALSAYIATSRGFDAACFLAAVEGWHICSQSQRDTANGGLVSSQITGWQPAVIAGVSSRVCKAPQWTVQLFVVSLIFVRFPPCFWMLVYVIIPHAQTCRVFGSAAVLHMLPTV